MFDLVLAGLVLGDDDVLQRLLLHLLDLRTDGILISLIPVDCQEVLHRIEVFSPLVVDCHVFPLLVSINLLTK